MKGRLGRIDLKAARNIFPDADIRPVMHGTHFTGMYSYKWGGRETECNDLVSLCAMLWNQISTESH